MFTETIIILIINAKYYLKKKPLYIYTYNLKSALNPKNESAIFFVGTNQVPKKN